MKQFAFMLVAFTGITLTLGMSSCKKEMNQPNVSTTLPTENVQPPVAGLQPARNLILLSKENNTILTYNSDNKVASVDYGNGSVKKYTYSSQFALIIMDQTYNGKKSQQITYHLDGTGKATKMAIKGYNANGNPAFDGEYQFIYQNGKLVEQKAIKGFSDHYKFSYDEKGRLEYFELYNFNGLFQKTRYDYRDYSWEPPLTDKIQSNPRDAWFDEYLKIFGSFSPHLVKMFDVYQYKNGNLSTIDTYEYSYKFNSNGYVEKRTKWKYGAIQNILETINYAYTSR